MLIIDEGHAFLSAAQFLYGTRLSGLSVSKLQEMMKGLKFEDKGAEETIRRGMKSLADKSRYLFSRLRFICAKNSKMKTTERNAVCMDASAAWYINGIHKTVNRLIDTLVFDPFTGYNAEQKSAILQELRQIRNRSALLMTHKGNLCRLEKDAEEYQLISAPCGLDKQLYDDIWSKGIPTLITSGSLSDDGDFIRIKRSLGLDRLGIRLVDVRQERGVF